MRPVTAYDLRQVVSKHWAIDEIKLACIHANFPEGFTEMPGAPHIRVEDERDSPSMMTGPVKIPIQRHVLNIWREFLISDCRGD